MTDTLYCLRASNFSFQIVGFCFNFLNIQRKATSHVFLKPSKAFLECQHSHLPLEALSDELRTSASNQVTSE